MMVWWDMPPSIIRRSAVRRLACTSLSFGACRKRRNSGSRAAPVPGKWHFPRKSLHHAAEFQASHLHKGRVSA